MEKLVTLKTVQDAIKTIENRGEKVSQRKIREVIGGGSPNLINQLYKEIQTASESGIDVTTEIPASLTRALVSEINAQVAAATENLKEKLGEAQREASDAIDELEKAQQEIGVLKIEIEDQRQQQQRQQAEAEKTIERLTTERDERENQVLDLRHERKQLIEAGEAARTEAAKAQLQVERADQAAAKAEGRAVDLEAELREVRKENQGLEKSLAVANQKIEDLKDHADKIVEGYLDKISDLGTQKDRLEDRLAAAGEKIDRLQNRIDETFGELSSSNQRAAVAEEKIEGMKTEIGQRQTTESALRQEIQLLRTEIEELKKSQAEKPEKSKK